MEYNQLEIAMDIRVELQIPPSAHEKLTYLNQRILRDLFTEL